MWLTREVHVARDECRVEQLLAERLMCECDLLLHLQADSSTDVLLQPACVADGESLGVLGGLDLVDGVDVGDLLVVLEHVLVAVGVHDVVAHAAHLLQLDEVAVVEQVAVAVDGDRTVLRLTDVVDHYGSCRHSVVVEAEVVRPEVSEYPAVAAEHGGEQERARPTLHRPAVG